MSKLLPCPFCGEAEKLFDNHVSQTNGNTHIIYCGKCHTTGPWAPRKKAGDAWNTRTDPVKIALAEALKPLARYFSWEHPVNKALALSKTGSTTIDFRQHIETQPAQPTLI